ncbi:precursor of CEP5-like [Punica granatum]|uniref:Uncharacterized protein n=2 Tax=Punica granatum TaxID=22663 RepID=A0A218WEI6_PUNGR|nr:precursor of CEP5-like [Punica granatum]OWM70909.1 hypothetical protein CDL15_Pgr014582 [Punica granatum]PKI46099.1 hypothetical protein CRG98_033494 [Punica granatum]
MAGAGGKFSIIFTIVILVSLLFLSDLVHGRKLPNTEPESKAGREETVIASHPKILSPRVAVMLQDEAEMESTGPGHSPGVGHLASESDDFWPTDPGHSPGAGHSTGPNVRDSGHP